MNTLLRWMLDAEVSAQEDFFATVRREIQAMALDIKSLVAAVERTRTVEASVLRLLGELRAQLTLLSGNAVDPALQAQIDTLANTLSAGAAEIAAAVVSDPSPAPAPTPAEDPADGGKF